MVVPVITGVVKFAPVPNEIPPVATSYQLIVPPLAAAVKIKVPASHLEAGTVDVIEGVLLTVATTGVLDVVQPLFVAETK